MLDPGFDDGYDDEEYDCDPNTLWNYVRTMPDLHPPLPLNDGISDAINNSLTILYESDEDEVQNLLESANDVHIEEREGQVTAPKTLTFLDSENGESNESAAHTCLYGDTIKL